ncbi:hypothetical protein [uncultured Winogradskyella sp.]|jgi:uncharacterized membrane protein|uniref:hypothetical protein n=1 Tax=uncultured Winogradskyella sp. TaxID=395353 RepID=UPI0025F5063C|nr:hypothetical protein [uncultured Winogradskyella sp.]
MTDQTINEGKQFAIIAYITVIGTLIAFYLTQDKKNAFTAFHVRQGLGLWILFFILGYVVGGFNSWEITSAFYIFFLTLFAYGVIGAATGKLNKLPIIGDLFQKIFKSLQ